jgi:hypothetical protein
MDVLVFSHFKSLRFDLNSQKFHGLQYMIQKSGQGVSMSL